MYKLTYFNIRGLAEPIRLMLIDNNIPFTDHRVSGEEWAALKPTMQFGQIPCLYDGDMQLVQSGAIFRHLARRHHLYGSNEKEAAFIDMVFDGVGDLRQKYAKLIYNEYEEKKGEFVEKVLPVELAKFEGLLKGKSFVAGDKISFADYAVWEILDAMTTLAPGCLDAYPGLKAYHTHVAQRPKLAEYLHSDARKKMPINGNGKQ